jgi:hypothetical protein
MYADVSSRPITSLFRTTLVAFIYILTSEVTTRLTSKASVGLELRFDSLTLMVMDETITFLLLRRPEFSHISMAAKQEMDGFGIK